MSNNGSISSTSNGFLTELSGEFETGAQNMMDELNKAEQALKRDPSNPSALATYQARLQEYTLFRNAQTSVVKAYKDIGAAIIQNFR